VAEALPLSESELRILETLVRHRVPFMVVGLSAAALQGAPVVTEHVDLWIEDLSDPKLARALQAVGAAYVPPFGFNPPMLAGPGSEPFDLVLTMSGLGAFREELKSAVGIRLGALQLKVLPLERILASKTAAGRPKDKLVVPVLGNTLRTLEAQGPTRKASKKVASKGRKGKPTE
jgi:hypothetical protein